MLTLEPILLYSIVLVCVSLILIAIATIVLYVRLSRKYSNLLEKINKPKTPQVSPDELLSQAREKSQQILQEAHTKSQSIVANAENYINISNTEIAKELEKANQIYAVKYTQVLQELQQQSSNSLKTVQNEVIKILQTVPNDIKSQFSQELKGVESMISNELQKVEENAKSVVVNAYRSAEAEVQSYKKERLKQVEGSIVMILQDIAKRVLMKEINTDEHEKLVMKALEEAKRQGVFGDVEESTQDNTGIKQGNAATMTADLNGVNQANQTDKVNTGNPGGQAEMSDGSMPLNK